MSYYYNRSPSPSPREFRRERRSYSPEFPHAERRPAYRRRSPDGYSPERLHREFSPGRPPRPDFYEDRPARPWSREARREWSPERRQDSPVRRRDSPPPYRSPGRFRESPPARNLLPEEWEEERFKRHHSFTRDRHGSPIPRELVRSPSPAKRGWEERDREFGSRKRALSPEPEPFRSQRPREDWDVREHSVRDRPPEFVREGSFSPRREVRPLSPQDERPGRSWPPANHPVLRPDVYVGREGERIPEGVPPPLPEFADRGEPMPRGNYPVINRFSPPPQEQPHPFQPDIRMHGDGPPPPKRPFIDMLPARPERNNVPTRITHVPMKEQEWTEEEQVAYLNMKPEERIIFRATMQQRRRGGGRGDWGKFQRPRGGGSSGSNLRPIPRDSAQPKNFSVESDQAQRKQTQSKADRRNDTPGQSTHREAKEKELEMELLKKHTLLKRAETTNSAEAWRLYREQEAIVANLTKEVDAFKPKGQEKDAPKSLWFSKKLENQIHVKHQLMVGAKQTRAEGDWEKYHAHAKTVNAMLIKAKLVHEGKTREPLDQETVRPWISRELEGEIVKKCDLFHQAKFSFTADDRLWDAYHEQRKSVDVILQREAKMFRTITHASDYSKDQKSSKENQKTSTKDQKSSKEQKQDDDEIEVIFEKKASPSPQKPPSQNHTQKQNKQNTSSETKSKDTKTGNAGDAKKSDANKVQSKTSEPEKTDKEKSSRILSFSRNLELDIFKKSELLEVARNDQNPNSWDRYHKHSRKVNGVMFKAKLEHEGIQREPTEEEAKKPWISKDLENEIVLKCELFDQARNINLPHSYSWKVYHEQQAKVETMLQEESRKFKLPNKKSTTETSVAKLSAAPKRGSSDSRSKSEADKARHSTDAKKTEAPKKIEPPKKTEAPKNTSSSNTKKSTSTAETKKSTSTTEPKKSTSSTTAAKKTTVSAEPKKTPSSSDPKTGGGAKKAEVSSTQSKTTSTANDSQKKAESGGAAQVDDADDLDDEDDLLMSPMKVADDDRAFADKPWINETFKKALTTKLKLELHAHRSKDAKAWEAYNNFRNRLGILIKRAKMKYLKEQAGKSDKTDGEEKN